MRTAPKRATRLALLISMLAAGSTGARAEPGVTAASILANLPAEVFERLQEKKSLVLQELGEQAGRGGGFVYALVIFQQPRSHTLRLLSQTSRQGEFRPEVKSIEPIEWYDDGVLDEHRLRMMFVSVVYRLRSRWDFEAGRISWELDPRFANDLERVDGYWELFELDPGRTLGRFGTVVDVGSALPRFLQDFVTRKNLPGTIERARRWVDSDGRYRP